MKWLPINIGIENSILLKVIFSSAKRFKNKRKVSVCGIKNEKEYAPISKTKRPNNAPSIAKVLSLVLFLNSFVITKKVVEMNEKFNSVDAMPVSRLKPTVATVCMLWKYVV
jgi:hypothetical protein